MARFSKGRRSQLPFGELSRRRQRDAFVQLRWRIVRDTPRYGGMFTSHQLLDEPGRPDIYNQWFDFLFLGMDGHTIWNAEIITGQMAFWDQVSELAWEQTQSLLTEAEFEAEFRWKTVQVPSVRGQKMHRVIFPEPRRYVSLDGLTVREHQERTASQILKDSPPDIYESFEIDRSYSYGVGLHMVVDAPVIDQGIIERAVHTFRDRGEGEWVSTVPIPRNHLPMQTEAKAMAPYRD
ncbi:hypothetical protein JWJ88_09560 [Paracoccus methylovorus]|uniref:Uncharacterized protein n=1 Tax=Paracoccus methylovorus TaxID=2812658 RepID=A0ABX7JF70_9RHOB|nr:hypothetical protein [Paracoccus methylovorus]QRZ12840.1 hypothetical protein JWJ88_09560 [Paracoccus methylovorus]